ncbi:PAS-domain containing protein [Sulfitobacter sp. D35]|uniref:hybrid sensor histidine kinase/response regulator n=1 Tax=Sulfitobacter sp. D35 TaxID=3083252 RepID=UPI00296FB6E9|nr:PAS-domain containing protein [Sulfitobacter sp. D35]MDW4498640.1 PAS-domain containing protein [Sulfitobacter sp. D35]
MIDRDLPLETQVAKQDKIIRALMERANQRHELGRSAYSLFQSAITLQGKVSEKTRDLEDALTTLGRASNQLETSEEARFRTEQSLTDALESMEGGFALFTEGRLRVFNDFFKRLIPDARALIQPGLTLNRYFKAVSNSRDISPRDEADRLNVASAAMRHEAEAAPPFVFALKNDRWFVITFRQTSNNNTVVLQTEITAIVRSNRLEKDRLIDAQEHFLKAAFDNMPQGVCTFSSDGTLLISNARFASLLVLPLQLTRAGTSYAQIVEYLNAKILIGAVPQGNYEGLTRYLRRNGRLHLRERHVNGPVLDIDVDPLPDGGSIVNVVDVTVQSQTTEELENRVRARTQELTNVNTMLRRQYEEQARVEEDLRVAKAEIEAAMSSKTRFFAAASHDLLQPINAAKLMISSLGDMAVGTVMEETVKRLDGSFQSMEGLLHGLLDISRLESMDMKLPITDFAIDTILANVAEDIGPLAAEKGLRLDVVPSRAWVRSDRRYLARSVQNLVTNAIQYTETGRVLVGCRRRGGQVVVEVWDTGIGISKRDQQRIFQEFTRVDPASGSGYGMGLGLSIVQRACAHLGHTVSVRSKPGVGSVFAITLPMVAPSEPATRRDGRGSDGQGADMDLIVLLVENDPGVLFAMTQKLETWGASVLACNSTAEAMRQVSDIGMSPDIILADYQLNGADTGVETILGVRESTGEDIPAIIITANQDAAIKDIGAAHRFSVLTKPVNLSRLRALIDWKTRPAAAQDGARRYDESLR